MLTIFTTPKPFIGHNKIIQENAIQSWKLISPACEVVLMGNDEGVAEAAARFDCLHVQNIPCTEYGTPLISGLFTAAERIATHHILCYVNADIIFTDSLLRGVAVIKNKKRFLLVGQRHNIDIYFPLDFCSLDWQEKLCSLLINKGILNNPFGMDYFIFPKQTLKNLPDLVVGRAWWDTWMIYNARRKLIPIIDGTKMILAAHQNHDYAHSIGGKQTVYVDGPEVMVNKSYVNDGKAYMGTLDAIWVLESGIIKLALDRLGTHFDRLPLLYPRLAWPVKAVRTIFDLSGLVVPWRALCKKINAK